MKNGAQMTFPESVLATPAERLSETLRRDLGLLFEREAESIWETYAWPPKSLTADERAEAERLDRIAREIHS